MQQNPSSAIPQASSVPLPSPGTPVSATPVSSPQVTPQSTPHTAGSVGLPFTSYETPHMSRHKSYSRRAAIPASTIDSLGMVDATPELKCTPVIRKRGRPCKMPQSPSYDDFPVNASGEEFKKWR